MVHYGIVVKPLSTNQSHIVSTNQSQLWYRGLTLVDLSEPYSVDQSEPACLWYRGLTLVDQSEPVVEPSRQGRQGARLCGGTVRGGSRWMLHPGLESTPVSKLQT